MRVLVLKKDVKERSLIREALSAGRHDAVFVQDAEQAWKSINAGDTRFVIIDDDDGVDVTPALVRQARVADIPPVYFLLLAAHGKDQTEADDILHKPFKAIELQMRLAIGQRILALADNLSQARDQLESTAMYDPLTGIMNQAAFNKLAENELERARRALLPLSIVALDIDNFKALNKKYGMQACDHLLRCIAANVRERSRLYDFVGRWTGTEFLIMLLNVHPSDAEKIGRRIIHTIRDAEISYDGTVFDFSVSAGMVAITNIGESTNMGFLIQHARQALADAKKSGGYELCLTNA